MGVVGKKFFVESSLERAKLILSTSGRLKITQPTQADSVANICEASEIESIALAFHSSRCDGECFSGIGIANITLFSFDHTPLLKNAPMLISLALPFAGNRSHVFLLRFREIDLTGAPLG